jgi:hypothetical protein
MYPDSSEEAYTFFAVKLGREVQQQLQEGIWRGDAEQLKLLDAFVYRSSLDLDGILESDPNNEPYHDEPQRALEYLDEQTQEADLPDLDVADIGRGEKGELIGEGANCEVYQCASDEDAVLKVFDTDFGRLSALSVELFNQLPQDISVPERKGVGEIDGSLTHIVEKASGDPVHKYGESYEEWSQNLQKLADAPLKHYRELEEDTQKLSSHGLRPDLSKAENVFYDTEQGFTLVDVNRRDDHLGNPNFGGSRESLQTLLVSHTYPSRNEWHRDPSCGKWVEQNSAEPVSDPPVYSRNGSFRVTAEDTENMLEVIRKLRCLGISAEPPLQPLIDHESHSSVDDIFDDVSDDYVGSF